MEPEARGHVMSRRGLLSSIGFLIGGHCYFSLKKIYGIERNAADDLLIVNGWIVKRSQLTKTMQNGMKVNDF